MSYENYADQEQEEVEAPLRAAKQAAIEAAQAWLPWAKSRVLMRPEELRIVEALEALAELEER